MKTVRTQVGIIGAGPAGLTLAHLLHQRGISSVVLEMHSREYVENRVRAGVLEQGTVELLRGSGVGERMLREGLVHHGVELRFAGQGHRIDFQELTGKGITIYAQQEVVKDLIATSVSYNAPLHFEAEAMRLLNLEDHPRIVYQRAGEEHEVLCDYVAGADGFHGISRAGMPADILKVHEKHYPFAWLGILARVAPASEEIIYSYHERGFALLSMRSPEVSRLYLQVPPDEHISNWSDDRIWDELRIRMATRDGFCLQDGPIFQKSITPMRSFVAEPMQFGKMFLLGDAAHIVPPTGAKGLNLAVSDVRFLTNALVQYYRDNRKDLLARYSEDCLARIWKVQRFSWWMTSMLHRFPIEDEFSHHIHLAELDYVTSSHAASTALAENYVGLPYDTPLEV